MYRTVDVSQYVAQAAILDVNSGFRNVEFVDSTAMTGIVFLFEGPAKLLTLRDGRTVSIGGQLDVPPLKLCLYTRSTILSELLKQIL
ncbi:hypothetical protein ACA910_013522 [Epithemia clementina (nom. ined.)]